MPSLHFSELTVDLIDCAILKGKIRLQEIFPGIIYL